MPVKLPTTTDGQNLFAARLKESLQGERLVWCLGSRIELLGVSHVPPVAPFVVGGATTTTEAAEIVKETFASMLIADDVPEAGSGIELLKAHRHLKTVLITARENEATVKEAVEAGVDAIIFRSQIGLGGEGTFVPALAAVARGATYLPETIAGMTTTADEWALGLVVDLTDRERNVLSAVGRGFDNAEIAEEMFASEETVKSHLKSIRQKLGVSDRVKLALIAIHSGI